MAQRSDSANLPLRPLWRFATVVLLALALRSIFFIGYANVDPWDDTLYLLLARGVRGESSVGPPQVLPSAAFAARRGVYYPIALAQSLFGDNEVASSLYSLLSSLGLVALAFRLARRFGGEEAALWSAGLAALFPLDLAYATRITADAPVAFWMSASVCLALEARWANRSSRSDLLYGASALALLVAGWTRLSGLIALPLVGLVVSTEVSRRETRRGPLVFLLVLAAGVLADGTWQWWQQGSFWAIPNAEMALQRSVVEVLPEARFYPLPGLVLHLSYTEGSLHQFVKEALGVIETYPSVSPFSVYAPLGAAALLVGAALRKTRFLAVWGLLMFAFFQYGFRRLTIEPDGLHYYVVTARPRYLLGLAVPLTVLLGGGFAWLGARSRTAVLVLAAVVVVAGLGAAKRNHEFYRGSMRDLRAAARYLEGESVPVYTDDWARMQLPLYLRRPIDLRPLTAEPPPGALVLVGGSRGFDVPSESVAVGLSRPFRGLHLGISESPKGMEEVFRVEGELHAARRSDLVVLRRVDRDPASDEPSQR